MDKAVSKERWIKVIQVVSFLALMYTVFSYLNTTYLYLSGSFWLSDYSEKIVILVFGIWRVTQEKDRYTRNRIAFLTLAVIILWLLIPYLTGSNFFNNHIIGSVWFFAYLVIIFCFGRRADCSWNCPCVGMRDTVGNAFRGKTPRGKLFWGLRHVKWLFMASLLVYLFLLLAYPYSITTKKYTYQFWTFFKGFYFASFLVIPWTGNRFYCRYICPWGALYGLISRLGFCKIVAEKEKCTSCGLCETNCDMGIPTRSLVEKHGEINIADCMGCGRCVARCPKGALRFVDIRHYLSRLGSVIIRHAGIRKV